MCLNEEYKHMHIYLAVRPIKKKKEKKKNNYNFLFTWNRKKKASERGKSKQRFCSKLKNHLPVITLHFHLITPARLREKVQNICESIK